MSSTGLTPSEIQQQHATLISNVNTFETIGISSHAAKDYLDTEEGRAYRESLIRADPTASISEIDQRAIDQITSGRELPRMQTINEPLVKIVPRGESVSPYSPFFARQSAFEDAVARGHNLSDYFGLPIRSEAQVYDIHQIRANAPTEVFVNTVAPTSELGGLVTKSGGAEQYLVPNRTLYSDAVRIGSIGNDLSLHQQMVVGRGLGSSIAAINEATPERFRSPRLGGAGRALGVAGLALEAYDGAETLRTTSRLRGQGNATAAQSGLVHFGSRSVGGWSGFGLGMATGAVLGVETGPGLLVTGAVGGVAGAVAGDQFAQWTDNRRIYRQDDGRGHTWSYDPDHPEQGWQRPVRMDTRDDGVLDPSRRMLSASPELANQLDYQATTMSAELVLGSPPPQQAPFHQPADKDRDPHSYAVIDNWVRGNDAQWQRVVVTGYVERVRQTRTDTASPERAAELEQAMQQSLLHNVTNSPMAIAARYQELHAAKGWAAHGPVPPAVQQARADLNTLIASNGDRYQRHTDGQWVNDGVIYDSNAKGALRSELEATREMLRASIAPPANTLRPAPTPLTTDERLRDAVKGAYQRAGVPLDGDQLQARFEAVQATHRTQGLEGSPGLALQLQRDGQRRYSADSGITTLRHDGYGTYAPAAQTSSADIERAAADKQREQQRDAIETRHPLFDQAMQHLQRLGPQAVGYESREQMENLAGALSHEARRYQLIAIDDVYLGNNGKLVAAGQTTYGREMWAAVEPRSAAQQPLEHSLQQLDAFERQQEQEQLARSQEQTVQRAGRSM